jgi:hypothetical protein
VTDLARFLSSKLQHQSKQQAAKGQKPLTEDYDAAGTKCYQQLSTLLGSCEHKQRNGLFTLTTSNDRVPGHLAAMKAYTYCTVKAVPTQHCPSVLTHSIQWRTLQQIWKLTTGCPWYNCVSEDSLTPRAVHGLDQSFPMIKFAMPCQSPTIAISTRPNLRAPKCVTLMSGTQETVLGHEVTNLQTT